MSDDFTIVATPLHAEIIDDGDLETAIRIAHGRLVYTRMFDAETRTVRDDVRASAADLAFWLADNWWRQRYEPRPDKREVTSDWRRRHSLTAVSGSYEWPPITIFSTGRHLAIEPRIPLKPSPKPSVFSSMPRSTLTIPCFDKGVDAFFDSLLAFPNFTDRAALFAVIEDIARERADPEMAAWRRLEARLGFDPDEAPDALIELIATFEVSLGEESVAEAVVAAPGARAADVLEKAVSSTRNGLAIRRTQPRTSVGNGSSPLTIVQEAVRAAAALRREYGLPPGPIASEALASTVNVRWKDVAAAPRTDDAVPYGAVVADGASEHMSFKSYPDETLAARRFELARVLGDQLFVGTAPFVPMTNVKTERQRFQRAFAQNFLAPYDDVRAFLAGRQANTIEIEQTARHFEVSDWVIDRLLDNNNYVSAPG